MSKSKKKAAPDVASYNLPDGAVPAKEVFRRIIAEVPDGKIMQRTPTGTITKEDLLTSLDEDTELAKKYLTDMMRIARDIIVYR